MRHQPRSLVAGASSCRASGNGRAASAPAAAVASPAAFASAAPRYRSRCNQACGVVALLSPSMLLMILLLEAPLASAREVGCRARFGPNIEGAAVDKAGNFYAVDFDRKTGAIGKVDGATGVCAPTAAAVAAAAAGGTHVNGVRVLPDGSMLGAALSQKRVVHITNGGAATATFCADAKMLAPNDLAISRATGYVYSSGMRYGPDTAVGDGDVWLCRKAGAPAVRVATMGRTNGIEASADGKWLYVSEAFNRNNSPVSNAIWRFPIRPSDGTLEADKKELVVDFGAADGSGKHDVDGMRLDVTGKLYVTRNGAGEVAVVDPMGTNKIVAKIKLPFSAPTNLEFGGPGGRTLFVVGRCGVNTPWGKGDGCVEAVAAGASGLYWGCSRACQRWRCDEEAG